MGAGDVEGCLRGRASDIYRPPSVVPLAGTRQRRSFRTARKGLHAAVSIRALIKLLRILRSLDLGIEMPERLRFRSGDDETLAWSNAFRQSSHDKTLVKIIVCGDELILRIGGCAHLAI